MIFFKKSASPKIFDNKNAAKSKRLTHIFGCKSTDINRLSTEPTP